MKSTPLEREWAQRLARSILRARESVNKLAFAKKNSDREQLLLKAAEANHHYVGLHLCQFPTRFLRLVAEELEGKLRGTKYEEAFLEACKRAVARRLRLRKSGVDIADHMPWLQDVNDLLPSVCTQMGLKRSPHKDYVRRLGKKHKQRLLAKRGRRKKSPRVTAD